MLFYSDNTLLNKVSPEQDVTLLARRCVMLWSVTDASVCY